MQPLVSEEVYEFTPPKESSFWPRAVQWWLPGHLSRNWNVKSVKVVGAEKIRSAMDEGSGVMLAPNHCRPCDPLALGALSREMRSPFYIMASAHLFRSKMLGWLLPRVGAFSMNREGMDRESLKTAIRILTEAKRPLFVFPEGVITRTNDRVLHLQEGISFLARSAAKARLSDGGMVKIFPVAMRYRHLGDWQSGVSLALDGIESRFGWRNRSMEISARVTRLGFALLALKEVEFFGTVQSGTLEERLGRFSESLLSPMEVEFLGEARSEPVVMRVKQLRKAILPDLQRGDLETHERERRWKMLMDLEVAQQASHFPPEYIAQDPSPERIIETVERYLEALGNDDVRPPCPLQLTLTIGDGILVDAKRDKGQADELMHRVRSELQILLSR